MARREEIEGANPHTEYGIRPQLRNVGLKLELPRLELAGWTITKVMTRTRISDADWLEKILRKTIREMIYSLLPLPWKQSVN